MSVADKQARLGEAIELAAGRVPEAVLADGRAVIAQAGERLSLSEDHTVVALLGPTGSGKSRLINAIVGRHVVPVAATRPTTTAASAIFYDEGADPLLDWLGIRWRHQPYPDARFTGTGLVLLDVPDTDSTVSAHREVAERLAGIVDVLVWVLDPQKYADASIHLGFVRPLAEHAEVTVVVLNQIDRVDPLERPGVLEDLRGILARGGLADATVLATSALEREGVSEVAEVLASLARSKQARLARVEANLVRAARAVRAQVPARAEAPRRSDPLGPAAQARLCEVVAKAAGCDSLSRDAQVAHLRLAGRRVVSVPRRLARRPRRVPPAGTGAIHISAVRAVVDELAQEIAAPLPPQWARAVHAEAADRVPELVARLESRLRAADLEGGRSPRWWRAFELVQFVLFAGFLLCGYGAFSSLLNPPGALAAWLLGGVGCLLAAALLGRVGLVVARRGARRRAQGVGQVVREAVSSTVDEYLFSPLGAERERYRRFRESLDGVLL